MELSLGIGALLAITSQALGQRPGDFFDIDRSAEVRARLEVDLAPTASERWPEAWRFVRRAGPALGPLLERWIKSEASSAQRPLLAAALIEALGVRGPERLFEPAFASMRRERRLAFAGLALAIGPELSGDGAHLAGVVKDGRLPLATRVPAMLALARYRHALPPPVPRQDDDAGQVAAALYANAAVSDRSLATWRRIGGPAGGLVMRGWFLARRPATSVVQRERAARDTVADGAAAAPVRRAAALCLARSGDPRAAYGGIDGVAAETLPLLPILASTPGGMAACRERGWLKPVPSPLLGDDERRRLAAIYAMATPLDAIGSARGEWGSNALVAGPICLVLAWRFAARAPEVSAIRWLRDLREIEGSDWLRVILGERIDAERLAIEGAPALHEIRELAGAGRVPRSVMAERIEQALWQLDWHPARPAWRTRLEFVCDAVLAGSAHATARRAGRRFAYLPAGFAKGDRYFVAAYDYYEYVWREAPMPTELRLRR